MILSSAILTGDIINGETKLKTAGWKLTSWLALLEIREKYVKD